MIFKIEYLFTVSLSVITMSQSFFSISVDVDSGSERASIELEAIEAIVKTASKAKFFIEFHSRCLEGIRYLLCNNQSG